MSDEGGHGVSAIRGNGYDPAILENYVGRIENLIGDLATERGESMKRCRVIHSDIKQVYKDAKKEGLPKKALAQLIETRRLREKLAEAQSALEGEDQESFEQMLSALGMLADTPLGQAAAKSHPEARDGEHPAMTEYLDQLQGKETVTEALPAEQRGN